MYIDIDSHGNHCIAAASTELSPPLVYIDIDSHGDHRIAAASTELSPPLVYIDMPTAMVTERIVAASTGATVDIDSHGVPPT